jgi:hypothetical protein
LTFFIVFILLSKSLICILYIVFCNEKEWIILIDFPREKKILKHKNKLFLLSKMYWPLLDNNSFSWQKIDFYCSQSTIKSTNSNLLRCGYRPYPVSSFNLDYLSLEYICTCCFSRISWRIGTSRNWWKSVSPDWLQRSEKQGDYKNRTPFNYVNL